jgi:hypothetical protein
MNMEGPVRTIVCRASRISRVFVPDPVAHEGGRMIELSPEPSRSCERAHSNEG